MAEASFPKLCGGVFFALTLEARKQRTKAREHYKGEKDGLTDPEAMAELCRIVNPDYVQPNGDAFKKTTSGYKSCRESAGTYLPFGDRDVVSAFDSRVVTDFGAALVPMAVFVERFVDTGNAVRKDALLVKRLAELIVRDDSIESEARFRVGKQGEPVAKRELLGMREVCVPAFLLGVWHFCVVSRPDNTVGRGTYDSLFPPNGRNVRQYKGNLGEGVLTDARIYNLATFEPDRANVEDVLETTVIEEEAAPAEQVQIASNPVVMNFNGGVGVVQANNGTVNNYYFGGKDDRR